MSYKFNPFTGNFDLVKVPVVDTKDNIINSTPCEISFSYASDTDQLCFWDGTKWFEMSSYGNENNTNPNIGIEGENREGYGHTYISSKTLSRCLFGRTGTEDNGGFRVLEQSNGINVIQSYLDGAWKTILTGVNIVTDENETPKDIEFTDFTPWHLSLISGDSDVKDINGLPIVQGMTTSMGVIQRPQTINGGTF